VLLSVHLKYPQMSDHQMCAIRGKGRDEGFRSSKEGKICQINLGKVISVRKAQDVEFTDIRGGRGLCGGREKMDMQVFINVQRGIQELESLIILGMEEGQGLDNRGVYFFIHKKKCV